MHHLEDFDFWDHVKRIFAWKEAYTHIACPEGQRLLSEARIVVVPGKEILDLEKLQEQ